VASPVEVYLGELRDIRSTGSGVPETSYYPALSNLLNEVGRDLKPRVRCVINLGNRGAGLPDGGLFTPEQFQKASSTEPSRGQIPSRGVIEAKPVSDDSWITAAGSQVTRYWHRYRQVLVTNYRDFILVGQDGEGRAVKLESFRLASSEAGFWSRAAHPRALSDELGERFIEYLKRVMLYAAALAEPRDVAWFLASYARDARARVQRAELPALSGVRAALEEALGLRFVGEKGEHFFRSSLVQTLFYGVFSAWVLWTKSNPPSDRSAKFDWRMAGWSLQVPIIRALFEQIATPSKLGPLGLVEVMDWAADALSRVDRASFFQKFSEGQAVQYFYEPFLKAFDPKLRKELGVWYTPPEIVQYMVDRIDTVLRRELGLPAGLADRRVYVLDPACGTGTYLVEVLKRISQTLRQGGTDALAAEDVKRAAIERVFGFEILPAPFVVAHLQLGLLLQNLGAPLSATKGERASVFLTNSLTGWEPPKGPKQHLMFAELEEERDAAEKVKREVPILVVLGNPPYNAFAGVSPLEEHGLVQPYKKGLRAEWGIKKFNLDDLYIRFFRLAERKIAEMPPGRGVVCYISNHSWISDPSFVVLRRHLLESFDRFWIENLHGNRKISEYAPDGRTSETIFASPGFSPGIKQGVAVSLWVRAGARSADAPRVLFRDDLNAARAEERRAQLLEALLDPAVESHYVQATPLPSNRYSFRPSDVSREYLSWPRLVDLCGVPPSNGLMEKRGSGLIDIDAPTLERRMQIYYDREASWESFKGVGGSLAEDAAGYDARKVRSKAQAVEGYDRSRLRRYAIRPFDIRWCYYSDVGSLWNRSRPTLWEQCWEGNAFLVTRFRRSKDPEGSPCLYTTLLSDDHVLTPDAVAIPLRVRRPAFFGGHKDLGEAEPNLSPGTRKYLSLLGVDSDGDYDSANMIWMHALAIAYSPAYLGENVDGIGQDWPRIPLPIYKDDFAASVRLGRRLAELLDTEKPVIGITEGELRVEMKALARISRVAGGTLTLAVGDLAITAGWGHAGRDGAVMPGKGKAVERDYSPMELAGIESGAAALGLTTEEALERLGGSTYDVYLNDTVAFWSNIPQRVWEYTIGGYQVIKKWLSYREFRVLTREISTDEAREVTQIARRLAAIRLLEPALSANYRRVKESPYAFSVARR
jgi:hypothetical protein